MSKFNKVILSRKGFDSSNGGNYSLFDDTGKYIVLPIPENRKGMEISNTRKYEDTKTKPEYLQGCTVSNLKELVDKEIGKWPPVIRGDGKPDEQSEFAHFDPWLGHCPWLSEESDHQVGAFGQVGTSQRHLEGKRVSEGSLFLFFSRFKPIHSARMNELDCIDISPRHLKEGIYVIYAWLKVAEVIKEFAQIDNSKLLTEGEKVELKKYHPHATSRYFHESKTNAIYIASKYLFDDSSEYLGCGYFPRLTKPLLLTATDSAQESCSGHWLAPRWELPALFHANKPTYFTKDETKWIWNTNNGKYMVDSPARGRGQEFVFNSTDDFDQWFETLLEEIHKTELQDETQMSLPLRRSPFYLNL